jgi:hypothetical protein
MMLPTSGAWSVLVAHDGYCPTLARIEGTA